MRANFHIMFSGGIYSDGPSPGPGLGPSQLTALFSPDSEPVGILRTLGARAELRYLNAVTHGGSMQPT